MKIIAFNYDGFDQIIITSHRYAINMTFMTVSNWDVKKWELNYLPSVKHFKSGFIQFINPWFSITFFNLLVN